MASGFSPPFPPYPMQYFASCNKANLSPDVLVHVPGPLKLLTALLGVVYFLFLIFSDTFTAVAGKPSVHWAPDFYQPLKENEMETDTVVQIMYPSEPPIVCDYDWEFDDFEEFTDNLVEEEVLTEDQKDDFKNFLKQRVAEEKEKQNEAKEARKKAIEEMSPETKAAFANIRFYKFYPVQTPKTPDISNVKVPFINRYYGKATEVL